MSPYIKAGTGNLIARIHGEHLFHLCEQLTVQLDLEKVSLFDAETEKVVRSFCRQAGRPGHPGFAWQLPAVS